MKVLALNGSQNRKGVTFHALQLIGEELRNEGIEMEIMHIGVKAYAGCMDCRKCREDHRCVHKDIVNDIIEKLYAECDGLLLGAPVHYMGMPGPMKAVLDRVFYATEHLEGWNHKPAAAVAVCRRAGGISTFHQLNNYLACSNLITVNSQYWNIGFGWKPEEMLTQDAEGVQTMQVLGRNMAWLLKVIAANGDNIPHPTLGKRVRSNFAR